MWQGAFPHPLWRRDRLVTCSDATTHKVNAKKSMKPKNHSRRLNRGRTDASRRNFLRASAVAGTGLLAGCVGSATPTGGRALTIGYQPFYAEAWSALVIRHAGLAEKYLPDGYSVKRWDSALQGSIVGTRMISGKNQVGYTGDMPTITAIANDETPIDAVGLAGYSRGQQCNLAIAPRESEITKAEEIAGGTVGLTTGTCTHRFYLNMIEQVGIDPQLLDLGIGSILAKIRQDSLSVGFGWEPIPARAVYQTEQARYLLTGAMFNVVDAAGIIMPDRLVENHPEAAVGWLKAELEAKRIMATHPERTLDLVSEEGDLSAYDRSTLRSCLYKNIQLNPSVERLKFVTDYKAVKPAERLLKRKGPQFLKRQDIIEEIPKPPRYRAEIAQRAANELGVETGLDRFGGSSSQTAPNGTSARREQP
jgi:ABC-type nitrate/sulfonate/bicarbonate transport system substrate-binding protein